MKNLSKRILYYGKDEFPEKEIELQSGPISLTFRDGCLRSINLLGCMVVSQIYISLRDQYWDTVSFLMVDLNLEVYDDSFNINYQLKHKQDDISFSWLVRITGDSKGKITFEVDGISDSSFLCNRIGLCVLHPTKDCMGKRCIIQNSSGDLEFGIFPCDISPHQPFIDIARISYQVTDDGWITINFRGDTFEMEDQRNWTDASFKTYCTSQNLPYPFLIEAGRKISQSVTLTPTCKVLNSSLISSVKNEDLTFTVRPVLGSQIPRLGLVISSHFQALDNREADRLQALNLSHLRVDLHLYNPAYLNTLSKASLEAKILQLPLEVSILISNNAETELQSLRLALTKYQPQVCTWLIFHINERCTSKHWVKLAEFYLRPYNTSSKIGAGTNLFFSELNRSQSLLQDSELDLVSYSINPQIHAFDNLSLVETLEIQGSTINCAQKFIGKTPIAVTPITLKPRFNPNKRILYLDNEAVTLPSNVDKRQMSLFGAAWTIGSLKYICEAGIYSATYYETTGWLGVMEVVTGSPLPQEFQSLPGAVFPVYYAFAYIGEFIEGRTLTAISSNPLKLNGLALYKNDKLRVVIANLTSDIQEIKLFGLNTPIQIRHLDETNMIDAMTSPEIFNNRSHSYLKNSMGYLELKLLPYAIYCIDTQYKILRG